VLDVASGRGRHARLFLRRGHRVVAVDRDTSGLAHLIGHPDLEVIEADLEDGRSFPFAGRTFDGVVVTNYLYRPILADLVAAVALDGILIYETYARGHERFGRPTNPEFLLEPGELLQTVRGRLEVIAYEDATVDEPRPARLQRICARRTRGEREPESSG
jgi:SAM-dependent methyltransferase